jgi:hypothetical protein
LSVAPGDKEIHMTGHGAGKIGVAVVLCGLFVPTWASGQEDKPRQVKDEAKLFGAKAIEEANGIIAKIRDKHKKDLMIETMDKGPFAKEAPKWANNRALEQGIHGVYIVITKEPRHFEIVVTKKTRDLGLFLPGDRDKLAGILRENLGKDRDDALLKVARFTSETLDERAKTAKVESAVRLVKDEAMLFGKDAVEEVNGIVKKVREKTGKDLFIETVEEGPDKEKAVEWAKERFNALKMDGVYLVVAKKPGYFRIVVGSNTLKSHFTQDNIKELEKILSNKDDSDKLIIRGATYVLETMSKADPKDRKDQKDQQSLLLVPPRQDWLAAR